MVLVEPTKPVSQHIVGTPETVHVGGQPIVGGQPVQSPGGLGQQLAANTRLGIDAAPAIARPSAAVTFPANARNPRRERSRSVRATRSRATSDIFLTPLRWFLPAHKLPCGELATILNRHPRCLLQVPA